MNDKFPVEPPPNNAPLPFAVKKALMMAGAICLYVILVFVCGWLLPSNYNQRELAIVSTILGGLFLTSIFVWWIYQ
jgi:uncharacterized membrane-anchored protein